MMIKKYTLAVLIGALAFVGYACDSNSSGNNNSEVEVIVGTWVSEGAENVSLGLQLISKTARIDAEFNENGTYNVVSTDSLGSEVVFTGTFELGEETDSGIRSITLTEQPATKAVITGIGSLVNEEENMIRIDAVLRDEPDGKFVHSKVWAEITTKIVSGEIRVPREAVIERNGRPLVFRLDSDNNRVEWIYIDEYEENNEWAILKTGRIRVGDLIAVDGHYNLSHFQNVLPTRTLPTDRN